MTFICKNACSRKDGIGRSYGHEKPDISGESVKPYWEQMNELPTIEEEQEAKQAESPTQSLMNQVLG